MKLSLKKIEKGLKKGNTKRIVLEKEVQNNLKAYNSAYKKAIKSGEEYVKKSKKPHGGSSLSWIKKDKEKYSFFKKINPFFA